ncbi:helix-turn-helix domain-containing protein [Pseudomonas fluorescens]|uniref:Helix-turn-helix domain-containing protein n=1 Tax=Pseudomonas fluorescens TaxID=294 RepID=A0A944DF85_PSEFL|nr:helix-turn-helix domain-containing protein [Pseudomonas fluorescens]MBT2298129.1 helix-turn-helix domain-containing protein [Pseudomonas fluorescens]MBT2309748.1 helix-turn-helix domain-containing protein [Pseudomonas fluorescens]MBT2314911.1 helix-turn-helix domain-containing protein [Pseudomonas fluorescens]MBT2327817.1 helix-turn-helix domain-containing protein [Pseudomonas fluorescens]MBT2345564.1 helix-turn-helix domain-containing protein [Pseudomonas fluorescens]
MSRLICADFDEFEEALYGVEGRYVLRTPQQRDWRLHVVELGGVALMFGREGAGTVYSGVGLSGFFNIFLPLSRHGCTVLGGQRLDRSLIGWMVPEAMFYIDASHPASWMTVAMSCEHVLSWAQQHEEEFDLSILTRNQVYKAQQDLAPLIWLARRLLRIDHCAPLELHAPAAECAARSELMDQVFRSLLPATPTQRSLVNQQGHQLILQRALELLDSMQDVPLRMSDLCQACNTSERTLRNLFTRCLGMSPHRYLMQHRLHAIRSAIFRADKGETLTEICARFGVWDFGRFAGVYRSYFGELPSQSLRSRQHVPLPLPLNRR